MGNDSPCGHQEVAVEYPDFLCVDCNYYTWTDEYYMVQPRLWTKYGAETGMLCIGCLEKRMGRQLTAKDFTPTPINFIFPSSQRLLEAKQRRI